MFLIDKITPVKHKNQVSDRQNNISEIKIITLLNKLNISETQICHSDRQNNANETLNMKK